MTPLNIAYDYGYGASGRTTSLTTTLNGGAPLTQALTHDAFDRHTSVHGSDGTAQSWGYDGNSNVITATDDFGRVYTTTYSQTQPKELVQSYDPGSQYTAHNTTYFAYDQHGNTIAITQADATTLAPIQVETRGYDALNRAITDTVSGPGSPPITTTTRYDENGNVFQVQQPDGDTTVNTYDLADQLSGTLIFTPAIQSKDQATGPQYDAYGYDQAGNLVQHVDADGRTSTASYDGDSRPVQAVDVTTAPTGTTTITTTPSYDPNGNTLQQSTQTADSTNPGVVQTHTYTATYNAAAWLSASSDDGKRTTYGYDGAGRLQNEVQGDPTTITTMLDPEGRVTAIGESTNGTGPVTSTFGYNLNDQPVTLTLPGPVTQTAQYDQDSRLTQLSTTGASGLAAPVASATYGYSANGWTTAATGISGTDTITHDALGRITSESGPSVIASNPSRTYRFSYDGNGNVLTASDDFGGTFTYSYSAAQPNELLQSTDPGSQYTTNPTTYFGYDSHGNTTAITTSGALTTTFGISTGISYDAQSRPITITHKDGSYSTITSTVFDTISLQYNAQGQRSRYTVALSGTVLLDQHFQYRDGELGQVSAYTATLDKADLHTVTSSGQYTDTFVYDPAGLPLEFVRQRGGTTSRYIYVLDGRNNVVAVTDLSGTVVDSYAYDWWGQQLPGLTQQQVPQQYRYGSYWQDDAVGWYWVNIRYYEPEVMRWLQPDPSEQDGVRTYAYVGDDPIDMADPSGLVSGAPPTLTPCWWATGSAHTACLKNYWRQANDPCNVFVFGYFCARNVPARQREARARWLQFEEQYANVVLTVVHRATPVALLIIAPVDMSGSSEVTVYRVQGGTGGGNFSQYRLQANANGNLMVAPESKGQLSLTFDPRIAVKFLQRRGGNAAVFTFRVRAAFAQKLRDTALRQVQMKDWRKNNPGQPEPPQRLDAAKDQSTDQFGLPESMYQELVDNAIPGTARYLNAEEEATLLDEVANAGLYEEEH